MVDPSELTEEDLEQLLENPEVVKTLEYDEMDVFEAADIIAAMQDEHNENYDVLTKSIADRSGRITQSTVKKVFTGLIEEADEYE